MPLKQKPKHLGIHTGRWELLRGTCFLLHLTILITSGTNVVLLSLTLNHQLSLSWQAFPCWVSTSELRWRCSGCEVPTMACDRKTNKKTNMLLFRTPHLSWLKLPSGYWAPFPDRKTATEASIEYRQHLAESNISGHHRYPGGSCTSWIKIVRKHGTKLLSPLKEKLRSKSVLFFYL